MAGGRVPIVVRALTDQEMRPKLFLATVCATVLGTLGLAAIAAGYGFRVGLCEIMSPRCEPPRWMEIAGTVLGWIGLAAACASPIALFALPAFLTRRAARSTRVLTQRLTWN